MDGARGCQIHAGKYVLNLAACLHPWSIKMCPSCWPQTGHTAFSRTIPMSSGCVFWEGEGIKCGSSGQAFIQTTRDYSITHSANVKISQSGASPGASMAMAFHGRKAVLASL